MKRICLFLVLFFLILTPVAVVAVRRYVTPHFIVEESEDQEIVARSGRCHEDITDMPVRAFVDKDGIVHVLFDWAHGYQLKGDNLIDATIDCTVSYERNDHLSWLYSPYTFDGNTVYALVHREKYPLFPSYDWWWNYVDLAISQDGGNHFEYVDLVACADNCDGEQYCGFFEPSNIVRYRGNSQYPYCCIVNTHHKGQPWWQFFLMCTDDLSNPRAWRVLTSTAGWVPSLYMPWKETGIETWESGHRHLSYNDYLGKYIALLYWQGDLYYSISDDLIHWERGKLLNRFVDDGMYPAFLQPGDPTTNFEQTSRSPYLYINRTYSTWNRDLLRIRLRFSKFEDDGKYELLELRMNERRGRKALDSSFYGNNGTIEGDCVWMREGERNYLRLSSAGRVVVPDKPSLDVVYEITIEAGIRTTVSGSCCPAIIRKEVEWTLRNYGFYLSPEGHLHFSINKPGGGYIGSVSRTKVNDGKWHDVMVVYNDSNGIAAYYIDNRLDALRYHDGAKLENGINNASAYIGDLGFTGDIDYVKVLNFAKVSKTSIVKSVIPKYGEDDTSGMDVSCDKKVNVVDLAMIMR